MTAPGCLIAPLFGKVRDLVATYVTGITNNADTATYTFTAANLGDTTADHLMVGFVGHPSGGAISGITVGGVAMTVYSPAARAMGWGRMPHPKVASADIVVSLGASANRAGLFIYNVNGDFIRPSPSVTQNQEDTSSPFSLNQNCEPGGLILGIGRDSNNSGNAFTAGLTHDAALNLEGSAGAISGHLNSANGESGLLVTASIDQVMMLSSWR